MLNIVWLVALLFLNSVLGSSHSEAPSTATAGGADITDFYMFRSYEAGEEDNIVFIMNSSPLQTPYAGPNYYGFSQTHFYQLHLTTDCSTEEHVFSFYFGANLGGIAGTILEQDFNGCTHSYDAVSVGSNEGVTIDVQNFDGSTNTSQFIPLKALGLYEGGLNVAGQNYFEFFHIDYSTNGSVFPRFPIASDLEIPYPNVGDNTFPGDSYNTYLEANTGFIHEVDISPFCGTGQTGRVFAGQRAESFSVNLGRIFDRLNMNPIPGFDNSVVDDDTNNLLRDKNVQTIAFEVPLACITAVASGGIIGAWATINELYHDVSDNHLVGAQFSRLANPLVNEVAIGIKDKQLYSISPPSVDAAFFLDYVLFPSLPAIIDAVYNDFVNENVGNVPNLAPTNLPRVDLLWIFLTGVPGINNASAGCEIMRLNTGVEPVAADAQSNIGVFGLDLAGYPNGRRPGDDVVDISLRAMMGFMCAECEFLGNALGADVCDALSCGPQNAPVGSVLFLDGAPQNAHQFMDVFPFLQPPHSGATNNVVRGGSSSRSAAGALESIF